MNENTIRKIIKDELSGFMQNTLAERMTPREVAEALGVTVGTLKSWRYLGKGPAYTKAGGISYLVADVNDYILRKRVKTES